jgi:2-oxoglutarate ferredoxin oxidoreductase subunit delta
MSQAKKKSGPRGTVVIDTERCKGCELCIPACPPAVLRMSPRRNTSGYLLPELLEGCTGCSACLMVCPDFCFEVYQFDNAADADRREAAQ